MEETDLDLTFSGEIIEWRGPAPFHFVILPPEEAAWVQGVAREVTYGWGMIPVTVRIGSTDFSTSLWPREGSFFVPVKDKVRAAEGIELGDEVSVGLSLRR
ncbi:MAG: DUF1905 domain-containing protein [Ornithinimicrobium sp.]|uniref:DUF1905 domain-containing protein n=1 Tax=Ornithinimicrobium sp. TaxID=1977084 RepID=UPI0026E03E0F|nr:DUF1905 domain-containing protein [Ornithinimicrobium sp.]MDO5740166.1 DUF1905 domain-containing protein [Ornithinimicrobium sp.]